MLLDTYIQISNIFYYYDTIEQHKIFNFKEARPGGVRPSSAGGRTGDAWLMPEQGDHARGYIVARRNDHRPVFVELRPILIVAIHRGTKEIQTHLFRRPRAPAVVIAAELDKVDPTFMSSTRARRALAGQPS